MSFKAHRPSLSEREIKMEFVSRKQHTRSTVYRRPTVTVRPRGTSSTPDSKAHIHAVVPEYESIVKIPKQDKRSHHNGDVGVYHDIIPGKPKPVFSVPDKPVDPVEREAEPAVVPIEIQFRHSQVSEVEMEPEESREPVVATMDRSVKPKRKAHRLLYVAAASIFLLGGSVAIQGFLTNQNADSQVKALQSKSNDDGSSSLPTDDKPKDKNYVANHKVSPLLPRTITISSIGVSARVTQVGIDKEGAMLAPSTAYDAGWYTGSSRPGENGAMVIDGHVRGVGGPGVFDKIDTLKAGDEIIVERGDGKKLVYSVVSSETVMTDKLDMGKLLVSSNTALPGLNLITCAGTYDAKNNQFNQRTVVYTVQK